LTLLEHKLDKLIYLMAVAIWKRWIVTVANLFRQFL